MTMMTIPLITHRLAVERAPGQYVSTQMAYWNRTAALKAVPVLNSVRAMYGHPPYTHVVRCVNDTPVDMMELPQCG